MIPIKIHILHLEDDPLDAELQDELLTAEGFQVESMRVDTRADFISALERGGWIILLADYSLPGFDGLSALSIAHEKAPELPFIFVSGTLGEEIAIESLKNGATDYVVKQRLTRLAPVVRRALREAEERRERRRAVESIQENERFIRSTLNALSAHIAVLDESGTIINVNRSWLSFAESNDGDPARTGVGVNYLKICDLASPPNDEGAPAMAAGIRAVMYGEKDSFTLEYPCHSPNEYRWFIAHVTRFEDNGPVRTVVLHENITQRKRAEQTLKDSEERFRTLVEQSNDGVILIDEDGKVVEWNQAQAEITGVSRADAIGSPIWDIQFRLLPPEHRARHTQDYFRESMQSAIATGHSPQFTEAYEFDIVALTGKRKTITQSSFPIRTEKGYRLGSFARDVTERKQAEEQIHRQVEHLNALRKIDIAISSSFDLEIVLDVILDETITQLQVDASVVLLLEPRGQTLRIAASRGFRSEVVHHTELKLGEGHAGHAVLEGKTIHISDLLGAGGKLADALHLKNESFADYYGAPLIVKGEVKGVLEIYRRSQIEADSQWLGFLEALAGQAAIAIDNAQLLERLQRANAQLERRVAERTAELNHTNMELEHANRAKDEFLANMSHELRTPLNSILGMSETLLEERRGFLNEYQRKSLEIVESSGHHLLDLINDILDLSKIEAGKLDYYPQPVNVEDVCRSSLAFVKAQAAKKSIVVSYINQADVTQIFADARRLKQILVNLLSNAVKFTPQDGGVTLQIDTQPDRELIQFSVIDTGIGISPENLQKLFQPFVQLDSNLNRQYEGTGLGLALVQRLIDLHGGSIHVNSEVGRGSRFVVNLSCRQDGVVGSRESKLLQDAAVSGEKNGASAEVPHPGRKILLAEDNPANVLTIGEYLESHGYEVIVAHDGIESITLAEKVKPDLILMDIQMPAMSGLEAIAHLRADVQFASTPIIALTALAMPGDRERCLGAGANEYMSKPVSLKALRQMIASKLQG